MARPVAPKPPAGPVEIALERMAPQARAAAKAAALSMVSRPQAWTTEDGITILIEQGPFLLENDLVGVIVSATGPGGQLPLDNPYLFANPPVKVSDETDRIEEGKRVENFREDLTEALKAIVSDAVRTVAKARGWRP